MTDDEVSKKTYKRISQILILVISLSIIGPGIWKFVEREPRPNYEIDESTICFGIDTREIENERNFSESSVNIIDPDINSTEFSEYQTCAITVDFETRDEQIAIYITVQFDDNDIDCLELEPDDQFSSGARKLSDDSSRDESWNVNSVEVASSARMPIKFGENHFDTKGIVIQSCNDHINWIGRIESRKTIDDSDLPPIQRDFDFSSDSYLSSLLINIRTSTLDGITNDHAWWQHFTHRL